MSQTIKLKRSAIAGKVPTTSSLDLGEIALNTTDGKAYLKKNDGSESIQTLLVTDSTTVGSVNITGNVSASAFSGSFFGNGTGLTRNMAVTGSDVFGNQFEDHVSVIHFDSDTGINVSASAPNTAFIKLGSHFRDFFVDGSATIIATGSDQMDIIANGGLDISTSLTDTNGNGVSKELIFAVDATVARTGSNTFTADQTIEGKVTSSTLDTSGNAIIRGDLDILGDINISGEIDGHISVSPVASDSNNSNGIVIQDLTFDGFGHTRTLGTVNLDDRYYTETEADSRFVNVTGDTITGNLAISNAQPKLKLFETDTTDQNKEILVSGGALFIRNLNDNDSAGSNLFVVKNNGDVEVKGSNTYFDGTNTYLRSDNEFQFLTDGGSAQSGRFRGIQVSTSYNGTPPDNGILFFTDTNLFRSAANTLRTNDSLIVDGNVGIGTTSPSAKLHIQESSLDNPSIFLGRYNNAALPLLQIGESDFFGSAGSFGEVLFHTFNRDIVFSTSAVSSSFSTIDTAAMVIEKGEGNVGIGTTSPDYKLDVAGDIGVDEYIYHNGDTNTFIRLRNDDVRIDAGGRRVIQMSEGTDPDKVVLGDSTTKTYTLGDFGIGTDNPSSNLHISGSTEAVFKIQSNRNDIRLLEDDTTDTNSLIRHQTGLLRFDTISDDELTVTTRVALDHSTGHFGIGTISPSAKLHVSGTLADNREFQVGGDYLVVTGSTGYVGIGTANPDHSLHIEDEGDVMLQLKATDSNQAYMKFVNSTTGDGKFTDGLLLGVDTDESVVFWNYEATAARFATSGTERMRIDSSGNVGIGTTSPSAKLHIVDTGLSVSSGILVQDKSTDATVKYGQLKAAHYTNSEEPMTMMFATMGASSNSLRIGGSYSQENAATEVLFFTAANNTTVSGTERMRIDSSGNVLIGKTSSDLGATAGIELNGQYDVGYFTRDAEKALVANRLTSDGTIVDFRKDGTSVGSIGTYGGTLFVSNGDTGLQYNGGADQIRPCNASGVARDNAIDLGNNTRRFKDLYLGGTGYIDGNLTVGGKVTAQEFHTEFVSASILYESGSTKFGDTSDDVHSFSGSLRVTGSGDHYFTDGNVGIGTTSPGNKLHVYRNSTQGNPGSHTFSNATLQIQDSSNSLYLDGNSIIGTGTGELHVGNSSNAAMNLWTNGTNRLHIEAGGNVGIGTTSPAEKLAVQSAFTTSASDVFLEINSGHQASGGSDVTGEAGILFKQGGSGDVLRNAGAIISGREGNYSVDSLADSYLAFETAINGTNTEAMRIDSNGTVLIGTTSESTWLTAKGFRVRQSGSTTITRDGNPVLYANRLTSNGDIIEFRKDGTAVGSISADADGLGIGSTDVGLLFLTVGQDRIIPRKVSTTAVSNNLIDLGDAGSQFKDLYLGGHAKIATALTASGLIYPTSDGTVNQVIGTDGSGNLSFISPGAAAAFPYTGNAVITGSLIVSASGATNDFQVGDDKLFVSASGNVGIGTNNPFTILHVGGGNSSNVPLTFAPATGGNVEFRNTSSTGTFTFTNQNGSQERVRIDASGNVGIGTTSPTHMLDITTSKTGNGQGSTIRINRPNNSSYENAVNWATNGVNKWFLGSDNDSTDNFYLYNWSSGNFALTVNSSNDNVGIGTTSPSVSFHVEGSGGSIMESSDILSYFKRSSGNTYLGLDTTSTGADSGFRFGHGGTRTWTLLSYKSSTTDGFGFFDHSTSSFPLMIREGGNVGIGTTNPESLLQVESTSSSTSPIITVENDNDIKLKLGTVRSGAGTAPDTSFIAYDADLRFLADADGVTEVVRFDSSGNVGIGTTNPTTKLYVDAGQSTFNRGNSEGSIALFRGKNAEKAAIGTQTSYFLSNVGIGTSSPSAVLHMSAASPTFYLDDTSTTGTRTRFQLITGDIGSTQSAIFSFNNTSASSLLDVMTLNESGNVGIGTTLIDEKLHVQGNIKFEQASGDIDVRYTSNGTNKYNMFYQASTDGWGLYYNPDSAYRLFVSGSGNVGIGTNTPSKLLTVGGSSSTSGIGNDGIFVNIDGGAAVTAKSGTSGVEIQLNAESNVQGTLGTYSNHPLAIRVNNDNKMYFSTNGNVGIGTTSPDEIFHINRARSAGSDNFLLELQNPTTVADSRSGILFSTNANTGTGRDGAAIQATNNGVDGKAHITFGSVLNQTYSENIRFESGGNVGIGTTSPTQALHVNKPTISIARFTTTATGATDGDGVALGYDDAIGAVFWNRENTNTVFATANTERLRIDSSGKVGIGTTSPNSKLDIRNAADGIALEVHNTLGNTDDNVDIKMIAGNTTAGTYGTILRHVRQGSSGADFAILTNPTLSGTPVERFRITKDGNVGIGTTSPSADLHIADTNSDVLVKIHAITGTNDPILEFQGNSNDITVEGFQLWYDNSVGDMHLATTYEDDNAAIRFHTKTGASKSTSNERMTIAGNGNVGIGTTSPSYKLEVNASTIKPTSNLLLGEDAYSVSTDYIGLKTTFQTGTNDYMIMSGKSDGSTLVSAKNGSSLYLRGGGNDFGNEIIVHDSGVVDRIDIDTSTAYFNGNVGIGTTSPNGILHIYGNNASTYITNQRSSTKWSEWHVGGVDHALIWDSSSDMRFLTTTGLGGSGASEKMRIESGGNVGIGTTSPSTKLEVNGTATVTALVETSTRELKENIETLEDQSTIVDSLQPVTYIWKESKEEDFGLIAEDVADIAPHLVSRNEDGNPTGIKYSKLSVLLLDVVQKQNTLINNLNERITKLENERGS